MEIPPEVVAFVQATRHPPYLRAIEPPYDLAMVAALIRMAAQFAEPETPEAIRLRRAAKPRVRLGEKPEKR